MALEEDLPEKPDDKTIPKYKQIDKVNPLPFITIPPSNFTQRAGSYTIAWGIELESQHQTWESTNRTSTKRVKEEEVPERSKRAKSASADVISDADMQRHFDKGTMKKVRRTCKTAVSSSQ